jgi:hypothetical protein
MEEQKETKDMDDLKTPDGKALCVIEGCDKEVKSRGLCSPCYDKMRRAGRLEEFPGKLERKNASIPHPLVKKLFPYKDQHEIRLIFGDDYKDLFSKLEKAAKKEFRTIELQILYLIDQRL